MAVLEVSDQVLGAANREGASPKNGDLRPLGGILTSLSAIAEMLKAAMKLP
jgi:hypothetical protein